MTKKIFSDLRHFLTLVYQQNQYKEIPDFIKRIDAALAQPEPEQWVVCGQKLLINGTSFACDLQRGHGGPCSWRAGMVAQPEPSAEDDVIGPFTSADSMMASLNSEPSASGPTPRTECGDWPTPQYAQEIVFEGCGVYAIGIEEYQALYDSHAKLERELAQSKQNEAGWKRLAENEKYLADKHYNRKHSAESRAAELQAELDAIAQVVGKNIAHESTLQAVEDNKADLLRIHHEKCDALDKVRELEAECERLRADKQSHRVEEEIIFWERDEGELGIRVKWENGQLAAWPMRVNESLKRFIIDAARKVKP